MFVAITIATFVLAALAEYVVAVRAATLVDAAVVRMRTRQRERS